MVREWLVRASVIGEGENNGEARVRVIGKVRMMVRRHALFRSILSSLAVMTTLRLATPHPSR